LPAEVTVRATVVVCDNVPTLPAVTVAVTVTVDVPAGVPPEAL
jgi:hypothetical protein